MKPERADLRSQRSNTIHLTLLEMPLRQKKRRILILLTQSKRLPMGMRQKKLISLREQASMQMIRRKSAVILFWI